MKKRLLMVIPTIALLASCGKADPLAEVSKSLPGDVDVVNPSQVEQGVIDEYISDAFNEMFYSLEYKAVYSLSVDLSLSLNGATEAGAFTGSARVKGNVLLGYDVHVIEEIPYSSVFLKVSGLTVESNISLPDSMKQKMPVPENISIKDVDLFAYGFESELGAFGFVDLSNHALQDAAKNALVSSGLAEEDINEYLDTLLGEKTQGSEYRPGLAAIDLVDLFTQIDKYRASQGAEPSSEDILQHPITYLLSMGDAEMESIRIDFNELMEDILPALSPVVGTKYTVESADVVGLEKTSIVMNVSSSQVAAAMGIPENQMPVNGVAGVLLSVGVDKGSEDYALEELNLSANVSGNMEGFSFSFNGSVSLTVSYNDQATMETLSEAQMDTYRPITNELAQLIISLM